MIQRAPKRRGLVGIILNRTSGGYDIRYRKPLKGFGDPIEVGGAYIEMDADGLPKYGNSQYFVVLDHSTDSKDPWVKAIYPNSSMDGEGEVSFLLAAKGWKCTVKKTGVRT